MAELVGGALLSGFLNVLLERMVSKEVMEFLQGKKAIPKLLNELNIRLISAGVLLNDAEEKQLGNKNVKIWLEKLKDVIYDADHIIDKINTEALRRKIEEGGHSESTTTKCLSCIPARFSTFERTVKLELEEVLASLKLLLEQTDTLGLKEGQQKRPSVPRSFAPLVEESDVYGRESEKNSLIELLLSDDVGRPKISVIPIVGMGGIGKSTLAQLVYYNSRVQGHFDCKAWVTVSEEFNVFEVEKAIFESITSKKCDFKEPHRLQSELKVALSGKKFLFVHDDVWNEKYDLWYRLKSPFESGAHGSKIIVTTRSENVAKLMGNVRSYNLSTIPVDDCWKLCAKHVFNNEVSDVHPDFKQIGIEIVKKCKGLPLAVISIAGLLRSMESIEAWRGILKSDIWELELEENNCTNILPALWLSYSFLPANLKRCFAFLSMFPKDYVFRKEDKEKMVFLWMAEGLLQPQNQKRAEDVGEEYLNALVSKSFLQRSRLNYKTDLVMHDLMHDLALLVSGGLHNISGKTRHLSYEKYSDLTKLEHLSDTKSLRTLLALPLSCSYREKKSVDNVLNRVQLRGGEYLKALSLSTSTVKDLPPSIGNLKHLRYLDLSRTEIKGLPSSLCTLYNLQTLLLKGCQKLTHLPTNMCHLINLRHLDIRNTSLKEMPPQMCAMTNLQTLSYFVLREDDGSRIKDLGGLQFLRGSFRIAGLQNVLNVGDVKVANLKNKKHLSKLVLQWKSTSRDPEMEVEVLNALEPHSGLNEVEVMGYGGTKFPNWVAQQSFHDMVIVRLRNCRNCSLLPPFGQLPSLKELEIEGIDKVAVIGDDFCGTPCSSTCNPFPCLEGLSIYSMEALEKWAFTGADQEGAVLFPHLKRLYIRSCKKLSVGLPAGCFPALEHIVIHYCASMVSVFPGTRLAVQEIDTSYPSLQSIDVLKCESLESFSKMGLPSHLNRLRIYGCGRLISNRFSWDLQRLSSFKSLSLTESNSEEAGGIEGCSFPEEGLLPTSLNFLEINSFKKLKGLNRKGLRHLTSLRELIIRGCTQLECLPEEGLPRSLTHLYIYGCPLLREEQVMIGQRFNTSPQ